MSRDNLVKEQQQSGTWSAGKQFLFKDAAGIRERVWLQTSTGQVTFKFYFS